MTTDQVSYIIVKKYYFEDVHDIKIPCAKLDKVFYQLHDVQKYIGNECQSIITGFKFPNGSPISFSERNESLEKEIGNYTDELDEELFDLIGWTDGIDSHAFQIPFDRAWGVYEIDLGQNKRLIKIKYIEQTKTMYLR